MLSSEKQLKAFVNEVEIGFKLSHPYVIKLFGACHTRSPPLIVCECAANGNMKDYLVRNRGANKWRLLYQAALGLQYLHRSNVVHGDLKLNNILVMADGTAKLADFGLSRRKETWSISALSQSSNGTGAVRWRAPESFSERSTFDSDIYSLGLCVYEVATGKIPYEDVMMDEDVRKMICAGCLPQHVDDICEAVWRLIEKMTCMIPGDRLRLRGVISELRKWSEDEHVVCERSRVNDTVKVVDSPPSLSTPETANTTSVSTTVSEEEALHSTKQALEVLRQFKSFDLQSRTLEWLFQQKLVATAQGSRIVELDDVDEAKVLVQIVEDPESPFLHQLYAFDLMSNTTSGGQLKPTVDQPDESQVSTWILQLADETLNEERVEAVKFLSLVFKFSFFGPRRNDVMREFTRLLWVEDAPLRAALMAGIPYIAGGHFPLTGSILQEAVESVVQFLLSDSAEYRFQATCAVCYLAATSAECLVAIAKAGAIAPLINLLTTDSEACKGLAATALGRLAFFSPDNGTIILSTRAVSDLVQLLSSKLISSQVQAARALVQLALNVPANCAVIANSGAIKPLVQLVASVDEECKQQAARALGNLVGARSNIEVIIKAGAVGPLVAMLKSDSNDSKAFAAYALGGLATNPPDHRAALTKTGVIPALVPLLSSHSTACQEASAFALGNLASDSAANSVAIAHVAAIDPLVLLLSSQTDGCKVQAARVLGNLACVAANGAAIVKAGAIGPLMRALKSDANELTLCAAVALGRLCVCSPGIRAEITSGGVIGVVMKLVDSASTLAKQYGACALADLACDSPDDAAAIVKAGAIAPLVNMLSSDAVVCAKEAARALGNLACDTREIGVVIAQAGAVGPLVKMLLSDSALVQCPAMIALGWIAASSPEQVTIITQAGAIEPLVRFLLVEEIQCRKASAFSLGWLTASSSENHLAVASAGAIGPLVLLLRTNDSKCQQLAARVLGNLGCESSEAALWVANHGAVLTLVHLLRSDFAALKEEAAFALCNLAAVGELGVRRMIVDVGAIPLLARLRHNSRIGWTIHVTLKFLEQSTIRSAEWVLSLLIPAQKRLRTFPSAAAGLFGEICGDAA